jgi:hypothetical protein
MSPHHDPGGKAKPLWPANSKITARFSACNRYRYELEERWDASLPLIMWCLMNPSVAGIEHADRTLIRTGKFTRAWGFGGQLVGNVHAYRVTDSKRLVEIDDAVGPENDAALVTMARRSRIVVLAYGQPPKPLQPRGLQVVAMLRQAGASLHYLRLSADGSPCHPLYLPSNLPLKKYNS